MSNVAGQRQTSRGERFFGNVLWGWLVVAVNIFITIAISPYIVRKLGAEAYGIWIVVLGLLEYCSLLDLGFRSATIKYAAEYRATNQPDRVNEIVNTGLAYSVLSGAVLLALVIPFAGGMHRFFKISPAYQPVFPTLIVIVAFNWALGMVFSPLAACLEGFQRFDLMGRILIGINTLRSLGSVAVLAMGFGLIAMALTAQVTYIGATVALLIYMRQCFPEWRVSPKLVKVSVLRRLAAYGRHTFLATIADRTLNQSAPLLIAHFLPSQFAGYFSLPSRMMQYSSDGVSRVAAVTSPNASELSAKGETDAVARLGVYSNRYCLTIFLPMAIVFLVYGRELIRVWINAEFAAQGGPLLPMLVIATVVALAAQYNSSAILYGLGKHGGYARGLFAEAVLSVAGLYFVIPRYGILGAAWVSASLMTLNRGLLAPILLCRHLKISFPAYMRAIFERPSLIAVPVALAAWTMKRYWLPGRNWRELLAAVCLIGFGYLIPAFFFSLGPEHRAQIVRWAALHLKLPGLRRFAG